MMEIKYMNRKSPNRIIISGGGTGGHIFPAISVANALRRIDPSVEILFVGAEGRMEMEKVPAGRLPYKRIACIGFSQKFYIEKHICSCWTFQKPSDGKEDNPRL